MSVPRGKGGRFLLVWVTVPDRKTAEAISRKVVGERLAACVNIVPGLRSRYWWRGRVETAREELLLIKTTSARYKRLEAAVRGAHPYEVCEVVAVPLVRGNDPYLHWIEHSLDPRVGRKGTRR